MASLQTLRNKGGIIVSIVIGIALIAFVLGDMLTSGSTLFGNSKMNVGEIDGNTVSIQDFSNQLNMVTEIRKISTGSETTSEEQNESLRNQAWELLIRDLAFKPNAKRIGINVYQDELQDLVMGNNISPVITNVFANPQTGVYDPEYLRMFINNLSDDKTGRLQLFWTFIQDEVVDQAIMLKFKALVDKAAYVTAFEAEHMAALKSNFNSVRFVANKFEAVADSTIKISDSEVRDFHKRFNRMFRQEAARTIEYVAFEALPSPADYEKAEQYIRELAQEFAAAGNVQQFASLNSQAPFDARFYKAGEITGDLGIFVSTAKEGEMFGPQLTGDRWVMARVAQRLTVPDSVGLSAIIIAPQDKALADSLTTALNVKGADFAAAAIRYSADAQTGATGGELGTFDPQTLPEILSAPIINAKTGEVIMVETPNGINILRINKRIGDSQKIQLATITYNVEASEGTRNQTYAKANSFATASGSNLNSFRQAAKDETLATRVAAFGPNDPNVYGLQQSRELVRWAFNGKKDEISKVMEFGNTFVVAAIAQVFEAGIAPLDQVKDQIVSILRREKKAEMIASQMRGANSVDELATSLSLPVSEAHDISFQSFMIPEIGMEPAFAGAVSGMDPARISKPATGNIAVYAIQITGTESRPVAVDMERAQLKAEAAGHAFNNAYSSFLEMSDIQDFRFRFY